MADSLELPLRIYEQHGGPMIKCLCGRELAVIRKGVTELPSMRAAVSLPYLASDISPSALLVMIMHARRCEEWHKR